jgi:FtsH-binding integral membrane protein
MDNKVSFIREGQEVTGTLAKSFISNVFSYMFSALAITGVTAYWFGTNVSLLRYLVNFETGGMTGLGMFVTFAPIGFVLIMSFGFQRLSSMALLLLYIAPSYTPPNALFARISAKTVAITSRMPPADSRRRNSRIMS